MNKTRRQKLHSLFDTVSEAKKQIEMLRDEEEEYKDNIPENLQNSARYDDAEAAVDALDSVIDSLDEALDSIEELQETPTVGKQSKDYVR